MEVADKPVAGESAAAVWEKAQAHLREILSQDVYERWIRVIDAERLTDDRLVLSVANDLYQDWLETNYVPLIRQALAATTGRDLAIELAVNPEKRIAVEEAPAPVAPVAVPRPGARRGAEKPRLNSKNSFENFVVGSSNSFAHAAALAVAQSPGRAYNPLFIYGSTGLGKTHLMQAIGLSVLAKGKADVCYASCEDFLNEYIDALQHSGLAGFRKKYRHIDVLLIDDIHFLAGKERIQEEFFHTFNALHGHHKQLVLTCDRPASEIPGLEQRLISRFEWGLVTQLERPDVETRMAILRKKAEQMNYALSESICLFIAEHVHTHIRQLEGALLRVASYASLTKKPLGIENVEVLLRDVLDQERVEAVTIEGVQRVVAEYFDLRLGDMTSKSRPQSIAFPRQMAMYLSRHLTSNSLPTIGNAFGKNHATVLHACRLVEKRMKTDASLRQTVTALKERLLSR